MVDVTKFEGKEVSNMDELLTPKELAVRLRVSLGTIDRMVKKEVIPVIWVMGQRRFEPKAVIKSLKSHEGVAKQAS